KRQSRATESTNASGSSGAAAGESSPPAKAESRMVVRSPALPTGRCSGWQTCLRCSRVHLISFREYVFHANFSTDNICIMLHIKRLKETERPELGKSESPPPAGLS